MRGICVGFSFFSHKSGRVLKGRSPFSHMKYVRSRHDVVNFGGDGICYDVKITGDRTISTISCNIRLFDETVVIPDD